MTLQENMTRSHDGIRWRVDSRFREAPDGVISTNTSNMFYSVVVPNWGLESLSTQVRVFCKC